MSQARARAAFLETETMIVAAQVEQTLKMKLEQADLKRSDEFESCHRGI